MLVIADLRQSAVADGLKRFVEQLPLRSIGFQSPLPPMADDLRAQRIQTPAYRDRPTVFPASSNRSSSANRFQADARSLKYAALAPKLPHGSYAPPKSLRNS